MNPSAAPLSPARLIAAFDALRPLISLPAHGTPRQSYAIQDIGRAFAALERPLAIARAAGALLNPWEVFGLRRDEVRNAAALAGLWSVAFGGDLSRAFLTGYLARAVPSVDWGEELRRPYRVTTEENPLGSIEDRIDIVIETADHLLAVEVKIDAGLGPDQLARYRAALTVRARWRGLAPHLILLAPMPSRLEDVPSTTWADVARAARASVPPHALNGLSGALIAKFGDHVINFPKGRP